jgi:hypothetical protein
VRFETNKIRSSTMFPRAHVQPIKKLSTDDFMEPLVDLQLRRNYLKAHVQAIERDKAFEEDML